MDKITKEELMKKLNLTKEELEKVAGGRLSSSNRCLWPNLEACNASCEQVYEENELQCLYGEPSRYPECVKEANDYHGECLAHCIFSCS